MEPILIAEADEHWAQEFMQMRSCLQDAAQGRLNRIEHIGATAVPGQPARPVIDIVATIAPGLEADDVDWCLYGLNFRGVEESTSYLRPRYGAPTHRVFLVQSDDPFFEEALAFRDWLRRNPTDAARYAELRRYAAPLFANDAAAYEQAKLGFFRHVLKLHEEAAALLVD